MRIFTVTKTGSKGLFEVRQVTLGAGLIQVGQIGQGTFRFGGKFKSDRSHDKEAVRLIRQGVDLGMNLVDTAEIYGAGHCEEIVGEAIKGIRDKVVLATKFSPENASPEALVKAAEGSLKRLKVDVIDIYQLHWPSYEFPWTETLKAMDGLVAKGKVRSLGVSNFSVEEMKGTLQIPIRSGLVSLQNEYSLTERGVEKEMLGLLKKHSMVLMAYSPLNQGKLVEGKRAKVLAALEKKYNRSAPQIVLNWLSRFEHVVPIPQTGNEQHLKENAASVDFRLEEKDIELLSEAFDPEITEIPTDAIQIADDEMHGVYKTLEEALENRFGWTPSPAQLAETLKEGELLKPVKLVKNTGTPDRPYSLVEGRVKYWAWVIAHKGKRPIPAIIKN